MRLGEIIPVSARTSEGSGLLVRSLAARRETLRTGPAEAVTREAARPLAVAIVEGGLAAARE
jgi:hypothetical protein